MTFIDPFREMNRLFGSALRQGPSTAAMPLDLYRSGDSFVAKVDLPGVDPGSIDIDVEERTLTIRAERRTQHEGEGETQWLLRERPSGTFARQLTLGQGLAVDKIDASYSDGVLTLSIPLAEESKPRKIQVSSSGGTTQIDSGSGGQ